MLEPELVDLMKEIVEIPPNIAEGLASESEILRKTIALSREIVSEQETKEVVRGCQEVGSSTIPDSTPQFAVHTSRVKTLPRKIAPAVLHR